MNTQQIIRKKVINDFAEMMMKIFNKINKKGDTTINETNDGSNDIVSHCYLNQHIGQKIDQNYIKNSTTNSNNAPTQFVNINDNDEVFFSSYTSEFVNNNFPDINADPFDLDREALNETQTFYTFVVKFQQALNILGRVKDKKCLSEEKINVPFELCFQKKIKNFKLVFTNENDQKIIVNECDWIIKQIMINAIIKEDLKKVIEIENKEENIIEIKYKK